jgi:hypothetical protein
MMWLFSPVGGSTFVTNIPPWEMPRRIGAVGPDVAPKFYPAMSGVQPVAAACAAVVKVAA